MGSVVVTRDSVTGSRCSDGIGMLKTSLQAGESFNVAVVFFLEVGLEVGHGVVHCGFILPFVYGTVKDAGFDKHSECETNGCGISDGFPAGSSKHLTVVDVLPKVFDRFLRHPWSGEMLMVGIEIGGLDRAICVNQMCQHGLGRDHGVAHGVILKCGKIKTPLFIVLSPKTTDSKQRDPHK